MPSYSTKSFAMLAFLCWSTSGLLGAGLVEWRLPKLSALPRTWPVEPSS